MAWLLGLLGLAHNDKVNARKGKDRRKSAYASHHHQDRAGAGRHRRYRAGNHRQDSRLRHRRRPRQRSRLRGQRRPALQTVPRTRPDKPGPKRNRSDAGQRDALLEELLVLNKHVHTALSEIEHKASMLLNIDVSKAYHELLALHDKVMHARYGKTDNVPNSDNGPR
ncbi:MAG: hypothetical protein MZV49_24115 [Rhodopseudomonas palustris]|nr:hypothetical protein [Rhodopseudomonas palustris]